MKVDRSLLLKDRLVIDRISGPVTTVELWNNLASLFDHPDYECGFRGVLDLREAFSEIDRKKFMEFLNRVAASDEFGKSRWAIIVQEPLMTPYALIFKNHVSDEVNIRVFSTAQALQNSLDLIWRGLVEIEPFCYISSIVEHLL